MGAASCACGGWRGGCAFRPSHHRWPHIRCPQPAHPPPPQNHPTPSSTHVSAADMLAKEGGVGGGQAAVEGGHLKDYSVVGVVGRVGRAGIGGHSSHDVVGPASAATAVALSVASLSVRGVGDGSANDVVRPATARQAAGDPSRVGAAGPSPAGEGRLRAGKAPSIAAVAGRAGLLRGGGKLTCPCSRPRTLGAPGWRPRGCAAPRCRPCPPR